MSANIDDHVTVIIRALRPKTGSRVMWEENWPRANWCQGKLFCKELATLNHEMGENWVVEITRVS